MSKLKGEKDIFKRLDKMYQKDDGEKIIKWLESLKIYNIGPDSRVPGLLNESTRIATETKSQDGAYNIIMKWISINLEQRKIKKEEYENIILSMENSLREKLGLKTFVSYTEYLDREDIEELDIEEQVLKEAANVMADFISYSFQPAIILTKEAS